MADDGEFLEKALPTIVMAVFVGLGLLLYLRRKMRLHEQSIAVTYDGDHEIKLLNELGDDALIFQKNQATIDGYECIIEWTVKIKQTGKYVIAGGRVESERFTEGYFATQTIKGESGDVISGRLKCPAFNNSNWATGVFRSLSDVPRRA